jgi:hypothetical protein
MVTGRDMAIQKLRSALRGALQEVKSDPEFAPKVLNTICMELGMDPVAAMYLSGKLKNIIKEKAAGEPGR